MSNKLTMLTQYRLTLTYDTSNFATLMTSLLTSFSPGSTCWAPGQGAGRGLSYVTNRDGTADCQITNDSVVRQSSPCSWEQSISYQPVEARQGRVLSADVTSWLWAGDGKWQRLRKRRRKFLSYCRWLAFHGILTVHSVFSVSASLGEVRSFGPANN